MADEFIAISQLPAGQAIKTASGSGTLDSFVIGSTTPKAVTSTLFSGPGTGLTGTASGLTAGKATTLATARAIYGNNFDGSAALTEIIAPSFGGTGVNNGSSTIALGGNFTTSGAFSTTITVTGDTNSMLPAGNHALACLDVAQTFTKTQTSAPVPVTSLSNHIATDASLSNVFAHTMTENTTLDNPTNMVSGTYYTWIFTQASAAKTLAFGNKFKWPGGAAMTISTGNGAIDVITSYYDGINLNTVFSQNFS